MVTCETCEVLIALVRRRDQLKAEVEAWMREPGRGLRHNCDAPMWHEYDRAEIDIHEAVTKIKDKRS